MSTRAISIGVHSKGQCCETNTWDCWGLLTSLTIAIDGFPPELAARSAGAEVVTLQTWGDLVTLSSSYPMFGLHRRCPLTWPTTLRTSKGTTSSNIKQLPLSEVYRRRVPPKPFVNPATSPDGCACGASAERTGEDPPAAACRAGRGLLLWPAMTQRRLPVALDDVPCSISPLIPRNGRYRAVRCRTKYTKGSVARHSKIHV